MELLDGKNQVPIFAPNNIAILNGKAAEFTGIQIFVVLWMWMRTDKIANIHSLNSIVTEVKADTQITCIFSFNDIYPFHNRLSFIVFS